MPHPRPGDPQMKRFLEERQARAAAQPPRPPAVARDDRRPPPKPAPKPVAPPKALAAPRRPKKVPPRLPDGSKFEVAYDASCGRWAGTLTVPTLAKIAAEAGSVFGLLSKLDGIYRQTLAAA